MLVRVDVTIEDIRSGVHRQAVYCPVALAIKRAIQNKYIVYVTKEQIVLDNIIYNVRQNIPAPKIVEKFVIAYDNLAQVFPFDFELEIK